MQSVGRAEELAGEAEREGERRRGDVAQAAVTVGRAVLAMEEASQLTTQALQVCNKATQALQCVITYSQKLSRVKTVANFVVLVPSAKVFFHEFMRSRAQHTFLIGNLQKASQQN